MEADPSLGFREGDDGVPGDVLLLGVTAPRPHTGRPGALELVSVERLAAGRGVRLKEVIGLLNCRQIARAASRVQGGSETDKDRLGIGDRTVPVMHDQNPVTPPTHVVSKPVAVANHGLTHPRPQSVTARPAAKSSHSGPSTALTSTSVPSGRGHNPASP